MHNTYTHLSLGTTYLIVYTVKYCQRAPFLSSGGYTTVREPPCDVFISLTHYCNCLLLLLIISLPACIPHIIICHHFLYVYVKFVCKCLVDQFFCRVNYSVRDSTVATRMAKHGTISEYRPSQESWTEYIERLELYFVAKEITDEVKKKAILLNACGTTTYKLARSLAAPRKPSELEYAALVALIQNHVVPKPQVIVERYRFHSRRQQPGEKVTEFMAELRRLSEHCKFGMTRNELLRDRLVCGVSDLSIQRSYLIGGTRGTDSRESTSNRMCDGNGTGKLQRLTESRAAAVNCSRSGAGPEATGRRIDSLNAVRRQRPLAAELPVSDDGVSHL